MTSVRLVSGTVLAAALLGLPGCTPESNVTFTNDTEDPVLIYSLGAEGVRERIVQIDPQDNLKTHVPTIDGCTTQGYQAAAASGVQIKAVDRICDGDTVVVP